MDVEFVRSQLALLISSCQASPSVVRDKFILQTAIAVAPKLDEKAGASFIESSHIVKPLYLALVKQLLKLEMPLDTIHSYLRLYLCFLDCLYHE